MVVCLVVCIQLWLLGVFCFPFTFVSFFMFLQLLYFTTSSWIFKPPLVYLLILLANSQKAETTATEKMLVLNCQNRGNCCWQLHLVVAAKGDCSFEAGVAMVAASSVAS